MKVSNSPLQLEAKQVIKLRIKSNFPENKNDFIKFINKKDIIGIDFDTAESEESNNIF